MIPRTLVVAVTITLKYLPTFAREFKYIHESMRLRGIPFTFRHPIKIRSIINCDKIVVLDEGHVVGNGTHEELMKSCEVYKKLYTLQSE